jgi:cysteinyl-tRNA synthetase, unknown class
MTVINILLLVGLFAVAVVAAYLWGRLQSSSSSSSGTSSERPSASDPSPTQPSAWQPTPATDQMPTVPHARTTSEPNVMPPKNRPLRPVIGANAAKVDPNRPAIANISSWGYQLQKLDVEYAAASPFDLLVIDYSHDGSQERVITPAEMARLKTKPDGSRRLVISYVSIGEAEDYRFYWDDAWKGRQPKWLLEENKEWKGNYPVCFWEPGWQSVVCGSPGAYLDRIQALGFDGVYLDKCDVFEDLKEKLPKVAATRPDLEGDMVKFIAATSRYLKSQDPNFLVVMQNAETLLEHDALMRAIDGVAKESLLYGIGGPEKQNPADEIEFSSALLQKAKAAGKAVMVVEYLNSAPKIEHARAALRESGCILYIAPKDRNLKKLIYDAPLSA